jgi:hypothetical protein
MNHIKFCGCRACKRNKHAPSTKVETKTIIKSNRRKVKLALEQGKEIPGVMSIGYTD